MKESKKVCGKIFMERISIHRIYICFFFIEIITVNGLMFLISKYCKIEAINYSIL